MNWESQGEDAPTRVLWCMTVAWLAVIRPHRRDAAWFASLWQALLPCLLEHTYQLLRRCRPRLVVAKNLHLMLLVILLALAGVSDVATLSFLPTSPTLRGRVLGAGLTYCSRALGK